jgi:predicted DNA-binding protein
MHFSIMVGFRLSGEEADKLETLVQQTGLTKSTLVRELVKRARVDDLLALVRPEPDEAAHALS